MHASALRRPVLPIAIAAALLTALLVLVPTGRAAAHDELVSSDPAPGSTVETLPEELTLTFSAALIASEGGTAVVVTDAEGNDVADGAPEIDGAVVIQKLSPDAAIAGEYTVLWQVVSSDGHPTDGEFTFTVASGSTPTTTPSTAPAPEETATEATTTASPEATTTPAPDEEDSSAASVWIWVLSIAGVLIAAGIVTWLVLRSRRGAGDSDSDAPAER
ncbi:copper resistance CopC family protein [Microbacterium sp. CIAB417]|uniref:copper resistance CopC family protein n=1 Tax=Microbacterium sp. CIAB417 TaxID=2860287 RepID=UPI001FABE2DA|nr:copper resistance CopC family protein [Microbacterium sp. CIAB417]